MTEQRIPKPGEWWCEKAGFEFRALVLCTRPLNEVTLEVVYAWEEKPQDFRVQVLVLSSFYDRFKPISPEDRCSSCAAILMRRTAGPKPRFIKFKRYNNSDTLYVRLDQIQGVSNKRVYTLDGSAYAEMDNAVEEFEKALKEDA